MVEYYTTVTVSDEFWRKIISEKIESGFPATFIGDDAGFTIRSKYGPAIWDMIELSNEYPDELFNVIVTTNNKYKDVTEYYEFKSGTTLFRHLEPLYHFDLDEDVEELVDPQVIDDFKMEITDTLDRILDIEPSYEKVIGIQDPDNAKVSNIVLQYGQKDFVLSARVIGQTYVRIDFDSVSNDSDMGSEE
jgi:hypothetical protein